MGITPAELWEKDPDQVDLMVAFVDLEHDLGPHGEPMSEATDPRAAPGNYEGGGWGYTATLVPDWAQYAIELARKEKKAENPEADLSHFRAVVERVDY